MQGEHTILLAMLGIFMRVRHSLVEGSDAAGDLDCVTISARRHMAMYGSITASLEAALLAIMPIASLLCSADHAGTSAPWWSRVVSFFIS